MTVSILNVNVIQKGTKRFFWCDFADGAKDGDPAAISKGAGFDDLESEAKVRRTRFLGVPRSSRGFAEGSVWKIFT